MACWEVSRRSGITGQTVGGEESGPDRGQVEGMAGWAPYPKARLVALDVRFWTPATLTADRVTSHFFIHSCLIDTPLCFYCLPLDFMLWWMSNGAKPSNQQTLIVPCFCKNSHCFIEPVSGRRPRYALSCKTARLCSLLTVSSYFLSFSLADLWQMRRKCDD